MLAVAWLTLMASTWRVALNVQWPDVMSPYAITTTIWLFAVNSAINQRTNNNILLSPTISKMS